MFGKGVCVYHAICFSPPPFPPLFLFFPSQRFVRPHLPAPFPPSISTNTDTRENRPGIANPVSGERNESLGIYMRGREGEGGGGKKWGGKEKVRAGE